MTDLLIHSMTEFAEIIGGTLTLAEARNLAEIGAEFGGMSQLLAHHAEAAGGTLTSIDPAPKPDFVEWAAHSATVTHLAAPSLEAMPGLADIDAWIIDGDHNYYTVLHELRIADALSQRDGKPLLALLHDVSWPCARRDFYYAPDRIPPEWRHPHSFDHGVILGDPGAHLRRGLRGEGHFAVAMHEGGPRNGVLTAVEDFLADARMPERPLGWAFIPAVLGLGIVFDASAPWAEPLAAALFPYHDNALIASIERNRLRNYLAVIEWQDRHAA
ncbi:class I SAM-dependent methyltransferase [Sphingomonas hengshuiensis]|uniref:Class I SAM-dependent methyltransferase n=1 Tax=Sphingomonas hengshuiensis TaxID=1609977 RepID=A0A7U4J8G1_9SPHN|nr:class I SAM-dependent methyltransferase [Sphingomonas hengshuiensis]AJP72183.1 hypothetical protein TS85_10885 [Sphingomonas hengshuiensis]